MSTPVFKLGKRAEVGCYSILQGKKRVGTLIDEFYYTDATRPNHKWAGHVSEKYLGAEIRIEVEHLKSKKAVIAKLADVYQSIAFM